MAKFVNSRDSIGDKALTDSILDRSITEYKEEEIVKIGTYAFYLCTALTLVDIPNVQTICTASFSKTALKTLILRSTSGVCTLDNWSWVPTLGNTPIASGTGYIYVPSALLADYQAATNWSTYSAQFRALEDYTVDGTTTGELDESKI